MGRTIHLTKADEAKFHLKIETESGTYEYDSIKSFAYKWCDTPVKGRIYNIDTKETARFHLRFKAIEVYYEYYTITEFLDDWQDFDEWLEEVEKELHALEEKQINFKNLKVSFNHFKELVMKSVSDNIIAFAKEVIEKIVVVKTAAKEYKIQIYYKYIG